MSSSTAALTTNTEATPERVKVGRSGPMDQMSSPASSPLALSDEQLNMVMRLAEPLHPRLRRAFVEHVAVALRGQTIGDGSLHRACAKVLEGLLEGLAAGCGRHIGVSLKTGAGGKPPLAWTIS